MRKLSLLLALAGIGVAILLVAWFDAGAVWAATVSVGWMGFGLLLLLQVAIFLVLSLAWATVLPGVGLATMTWGRMVRDAATTCLPFSPIGGYVLGARAITMQGLAWPTAAAGTVVDVTAEILAQLLFALFGIAGLALLLPGDAGSSLTVPLGVAVATALTLLLAGLWQRRRVGAALRQVGLRLLGDWFANQGGISRLQSELTRLDVPWRLGLAVLLHLAGWFVTGLGTWLSLRLLGAAVDILPMIALEALLDALIGAAFVVPGAAGVQEAGYIGVGALFGVPAELALAVSLLRRGKDLVWGVPILLFWQWREVRRWRRRALRNDRPGPSL